MNNPTELQINAIIINNVLQKLERTGCSEGVNLLGQYLKLFKQSNFTKLKELETLCFELENIKPSGSGYDLIVEYCHAWNQKKCQIVDFLKPIV